MSIDQIKQLVQTDLIAVDDLITSQLESPVLLISQLGQYIIQCGGKRLRPLLLLLTARACAYDGMDHVAMAVTIEFFHTATLLHDDVVDDSDQRRGNKTANNIWGSKASILVGDYLFTHAFELMSSIDNIAVHKVLAHASSVITQGEVEQFTCMGKLDTSEQQYRRVIACKTAELFAAASEIAAILAKVDDETRVAMRDFGMHLGNAFQIIDDYLDYAADTDKLGKNLGDDLAEGKLTLPLIYALQRANEQQNKLLTAAVTDRSIDNLAEIIETLKATDALADTLNAAKQEIDIACTKLCVLPESEYKAGLLGLADFALQRCY